MRRTRFQSIRYVALLGCGLAGTAMLAGCGKDEEKAEADVEETGVDVEKNPLGALQQLAEVGQEMADKAEKMEKHEPIAPVKFDALIPLLPSPAGWEKKGEAKAETAQMGEFQISTAKQRYEQGEGKERKTMNVMITDGSYVPMVYAPFLMMSKFSREGTDGHSKGLKIDGQPAFEEWKKRNGSIKLSILVKDRFLVTLEGRNGEVTTAREWAKLIDLGLLAKWAKDEVTGDQVSPPPAPEPVAKEAEAPSEDGAAQPAKAED